MEKYPIKFVNLLFFLVLTFVPHAYSACLTNTEQVYIQSIETQLNITNGTFQVLFEDMCLKYATKLDLNTTQSSLDTTVNNLKHNYTIEMDEQRNWTMDYTDNVIINTTKEEVQLYKDELEMGSKLLDIILILNRSSDWEEWKQESDAEQVKFIDDIDEKLINWRETYATKDYVDNQIINMSYTYYQPVNTTPNYMNWIFITIVVVILGVVTYSKLKSKVPTVIPMTMPHKEMDIKHLQLYKHEQEQDAQNKDKPEAGKRTKK